MQNDLLGEMFAMQKEHLDLPSSTFSVIYDLSKLYSKSVGQDTNLPLRLQKQILKLNQDAGRPIPRMDPRKASTACTAPLLSPPPKKKHLFCIHHAGAVLDPKGGL